MVNNHSEKVRKLWHNFFVKEENFLDWLNRNTRVIDSLETGSTLSYKKLINARTKPPKAFRHICYMTNPDDSSEAIARIAELKEHYILPVLEEAKENKENEIVLDKLSKKFPSRFAEFYFNVRQINISVTPAFSSSKIKVNNNQELLLKSYNAHDSQEYELLKDRAYEELKQLVRFGLTTTDLYKNPKSGVLKITIESDELLKLANATQLQLRKNTGDQYRARVYQHDGIVLPVRFGLIILNEKAPVYYALPQPERKHSLEKSGNEFKLPISTYNFRIWKN